MQKEMYWHVLPYHIHTIFTINGTNTCNTCKYKEHMQYMPIQTNTYKYRLTPIWRWG